MRFAGVVSCATATAAAAAAAVQRLCCASAFQKPRKCGLESPSLCSERHAHMHTYAHTSTHAHTEAQFVAVAKRRPRSAAAVVAWLPQRQKAYGAMYRYTAAADNTAKKKVRNTEVAPLFSVLETAVFLNRTATCCSRSPAIHSRKKKKYNSG